MARFQLFLQLVLLFALTAWAIPIARRQPPDTHDAQLQPAPEPAAWGQDLINSLASSPEEAEQLAQLVGAIANSPADAEFVDKLYSAESEPDTGVLTDADTDSEHSPLAKREWVHYGGWVLNGDSWFYDSEQKGKGTRFIGRIDPSMFSFKERVKRNFDVQNIWEKIKAKWHTLKDNVHKTWTGFKEVVGNIWNRLNPWGPKTYTPPAPFKTGDPRFDDPNSLEYDRVSPMGTPYPFEVEHKENAVDKGKVPAVDIKQDDGFANLDPNNKVLVAQQPKQPKPQAQTETAKNQGHSSQPHVLDGAVAEPRPHVVVAAEPKNGIQAPEPERNRRIEFLLEVLAPLAESHEKTHDDIARERVKAVMKGDAAALAEIDKALKKDEQWHIIQDDEHAARLEAARAKDAAITQAANGIARANGLLPDRVPSPLSDHGSSPKSTKEKFLNIIKKPFQIFKNGATTQHGENSASAAATQTESAGMISSQSEDVRSPPFPTALASDDSPRWLFPEWGTEDEDQLTDAEIKMINPDNPFGTFQNPNPFLTDLENQFIEKKEIAYYLEKEAIELKQKAHEARVEAEKALHKLAEFLPEGERIPIDRPPPAYQAKTEAPATAEAPTTAKAPAAAENPATDDHRASPESLSPTGPLYADDISSSGGTTPFRRPGTPYNHNPLPLSPEPQSPAPSHSQKESLTAGTAFSPEKHPAPATAAVAGSAKPKTETIIGPSVAGASRPLKPALKVNTKLDQETKQNEQTVPVVGQSKESSTSSQDSFRTAKTHLSPSPLTTKEQAERDKQFTIAGPSKEPRTSSSDSVRTAKTNPIPSPTTPKAEAEKPEDKPYKGPPPGPDLRQQWMSQHNNWRHPYAHRFRARVRKAFKVDHTHTVEPLTWWELKEISHGHFRPGPPPTAAPVKALVSAKKDKGKGKEKETIVG